jgi:hypothetical protein
LALVNQDKFDPINQLITLSIIPFSGTYCNTYLKTFQMFTPSTPLETIAVCVQFVRHQSVKMRDDANLDVVYLIDSRFRRNVERTVSYISFLLGLGYSVNRNLELVIADAN